MLQFIALFSGIERFYIKNENEAELLSGIGLQIFYLMLKGKQKCGNGSFVHQHKCKSHSSTTHLNTLPGPGAGPHGCRRVH